MSALNHLPSGIYPLSGLIGHAHLLVHDRECLLIDTGMMGEISQLRRLLDTLDLGFDSIKAILLTHGHLDHAGNATRLRELTGAPVHAHPADKRHLRGDYPYRGINRPCGWLETAGHALIRYRPVNIDIPLDDGQTLPYWGGLRVIHTPGHTLGHCAFYSSCHDLLFSGDLFACMPWGDVLPAPVLNTAPQSFPETYRKVRRLNPRLMLPFHYSLNRADGLRFRHAFDHVCRLFEPRPAPSVF